MSTAYPPIDKSFVGQFKDLRDRISRVERRKMRPSVLRGTTAERNAIFGVPTTDADRVVLANQMIAWFNTDLGWQESFYAPIGLTGLTARGLIAGTPAGWYPTGSGPWITMEPTATFAATAGNPVGNWNGSVRQYDPSNTFFTTNSLYLACNVPGYYDIVFWTLQATGTGIADWHFRHYNAAGSVVIRQMNAPGNTLVSTLWTRAFGFLENEPMGAGERVYMYCQSGALTVHNGSGATIRGQIGVKYHGPLLAPN